MSNLKNSQPDGLLQVAKDLYEAIAGWKNEGYLFPPMTANSKWQKLEWLEQRLENAIFDIEPDYEP
jgi:hypothetical protein